MLIEHRVIAYNEVRNKSSMRESAVCSVAFITSGEPFSIVAEMSGR